jgi:hypothetical protein
VRFVAACTCDDRFRLARSPEDTFGDTYARRSAAVEVQDARGSESLVARDAGQELRIGRWIGAFPWVPTARPVPRVRSSAECVPDVGLRWS